MMKRKFSEPQRTNADVIVLEGAQQVTIADNAIECNQTTAGNMVAILGRNAPAQSDDVNTKSENEARDAVPLEGLVVANNRARGKCSEFVRVTPGSTPIGVGAVSIIGNQTKEFAIGVRFPDSNLTPPTIRPRITNNLFEGTPIGQFVVPDSLQCDGENGTIGP
jgi:hypothetical protein